MIHEGRDEASKRESDMPYVFGGDNATVRTPENAGVFLETLAETANVSEACRAVGISRSAAYVWREEDKEFRAAWELAAKIGTGVLEDEARRRAVDGVEEPMVSAGKLVTTVRKYSDTLLIFLLKARDPKYKDRSSVELTGRDGGPVAIEIEDVRAKLAARVSRSVTESAGGGTAEDPQ